MTIRIGIIVGVATVSAVCYAFAQAPTSNDPDQLYRHREDLEVAGQAADLWQARARTDFESAWKLSRICYWIGEHEAGPMRRRALERGIEGGEEAIRLRPDRPEGHFWLAANMGTLAESSGIVQGLKYRGRIKQELERAIAADPQWQGGSADAALGQWYFEVPRLFGGSQAKAEAHLRQALAYDADNRLALSLMADMLVATGRHAEAQMLLQRLLDAPIDEEWAPEDKDYKRKAAERLKALAADH